MRRCITNLSAILLLLWSVPGFGQEAAEPPEAAERPEGAPEEGAPEAGEGTESEPVQPEEGGQIQAEQDEVEDPFAQPEPEPTAEPEPPAEETLPPPPIEAAAPEISVEESAEGEPGSDDQPAETEERVRVGAEEQYSDALPFRNSLLVYENIFNAYQVSSLNDDITSNPYYGMSLSILPRWYFTDALSVRLRLDVEGELTNADDTSLYHETRVSDLYLDLVYNPVYTIPQLELNVGLGVRAQFPTSLEAQAAQRYAVLGPSLLLSRVFDVLDGLIISYTFRYMKHLNRFTDQSVFNDENAPPQPCIGSDPQPSCFSSGDMLTNHSFTNTLQLGLDFLRSQWKPMNFSIAVIFYNNLNYAAPDATLDGVMSGGGDFHLASNSNAVVHSAAIWYVIELGLEITDYLSIAIGSSTFSPQLAPDSTYRTPFFNRYTNVYLDLSLDIERLVAAFRH